MRQPKQSGYRKDRALLWTVVITAAVLGFATWLSVYYTNLLGRWY